MFLESFFEMNKKNCKESINLYKRFLVRMDNVSKFLADAEVCTVYQSNRGGVVFGEIKEHFYVKRFACFLDN